MIKAIRKTSLIDYPNNISSVIFTGGCNFMCHYCYNTDLVYKYEEMKTIPFDYTLDLLLSRKYIIDHVVITGGEPTLHNMIDFIKQLKSNGFKIKLDSNVSNKNFELFIPYIDYIAVDYKAPFKQYKEVVGISIDELLLNNNFQLAKTIDHEFRSVVWKDHPLLDNIDEIVNVIGLKSNYYIQNVKYVKDFIPLEDNEIQNFVQTLQKIGVQAFLR